jgi:outer membrane protein OmpA-like peptidoglycan-associated protein
MAFVIFATVLFVPGSAEAQRDAGSVSVDLSVLDQLGTPRNIPQLLQPGVRALMMPNSRTTGSNRFSAPALSQPRGNATPAAGQLMLKPPSKIKRAAPTRRMATKATPRKLTRKPVVQRPRPPALPKIAARPTVAPTAPSVPTPPKPARAASLPVPPPPAPAMVPPPAAPAVTPPPPPPVAKIASQPAPPAPKQTASLPPSGQRAGSALAAGQQFRLSFGAGSAAVQNASGTQLDDIAKSLKGNDALRLQLLAFSGGGAQTPSQARRLSLSRALAVRSHLIKQGVRSTRIDVRALGNKSEGGPPDRVDVIVTKR